MITHMGSVSELARALADKAALDEIGMPSDTVNSRKTVWTELADRLEAEGVQKTAVSKTIIGMVENAIYERTGEKKRFNNSWFFTVMRVRGNVDPGRNHHVRDDPPVDTYEYQTKTSEDEENSQIPTTNLNRIEYDILRLRRHVARREANIIDKILAKLDSTRNVKASDQTLSDPERRAAAKEWNETRQRRADAVVWAVRHGFGGDKNRGDYWTAEETKIIDHALKEVRDELRALVQSYESIDLDGRLTLTMYEKAMIMLAIDMGYNRNDLAQFFRITAKHMKTGIDNGHSRGNVLKVLEWFGRCVSCGAMIHEEYQAKLKQYKLGAKCTYEDYEKELLDSTTYSGEVYKLRTENTRLREEVAEWKKKVETEKIP